MLRISQSWRRIVTMTSLVLMLLTGIVPVATTHGVVSAEEDTPQTEEIFQFSFTVGSNGWKGTSIHPGVGTRVDVRYVSGSWTVGANNPYTDGRGIEGKRSTCAPVQSANAGGLVAKFGIRSAFYIGNYLSFDVDNSDELIFSINDCPEWLSDNGGALGIQVTVHYPSRTLQGNVYLNNVPVWTGFTMNAQSLRTHKEYYANTVDQWGFYKFEAQNELPVGDYKFYNNFTDGDCTQNTPMTIHIPRTGDIAPDVRIQCPIAKPALHEPKDNHEISAETVVTLSWDSVKYATEYAVELYGPNTSIQSGRISGTTYHIGKLTAGSYHWKVEAYRGTTFSGFVETNFTVKAEPSKYTIVFVPGYQGLNKSNSMNCDQGLQEVGGNTPDGTDPAFPEMLDWLADDYSTYYTHWTSGPERSMSIKDAAKCIGAQIDELKELAPDESPIVIVCHSMGCLIARYYLESGDYPEASTEIVKLFSIGAPHLGISEKFLWFCNKTLFKLLGFGENSCNPTVQESFGEVLGKKPKALEGTQRISGIDYYLITGNSKSRIAWASNIRTDEDSSDFLVSVNSGTGLSGALGTFRTDEDHADVDGTRNPYLTLRKGDGNRSQAYNIVKGILEQTMDAEVFAIDAVAASDSASRTTLADVSEKFSLKQGETVTINVDTTTGKGMLVVDGDNSSSRSIQVVSPSGVIEYFSSDASITSDVVDYVQGYSAGLILIDSTEAGVWKVNISAFNSLPDMEVNASFNSDVYGEIELQGKHMTDEYMIIVPKLVGVDSDQVTVTQVSIKHPDGSWSGKPYAPYYFLTMDPGYYTFTANLSAPGYERTVTEYFEILDKSYLYLPLVTR